MLTTLLIALLSGLASLIHIPVANSDFRISLGLIVMMVAILLFEKKNVISISFWTGLMVCLFRIGVQAFSQDLTAQVVGSLLLEIFFYLGYGILYHYTVVVNKNIYKAPLVFALIICDFGGNFLEYFMRFLYVEEVWQQTSLLTLLLAALIRSVAIVVIFFLINRLAGDKFTKKEETGNA